ncbi:MAG: hypothetical protein IPK85_02995 [Gemmatimonadetes bacterium]|nr:hypothetical protein [Gemmatimonadota bacterium]
MRNKVQVHNIKVECTGPIPAKRAQAEAAADELREVLPFADVRVVMRHGHAPVLRVRSCA